MTLPSVSLLKYEAMYVFPKQWKKNFQTRLDNNSTTFFFSHELRAFSFSLFSSVKNINNMMATTKFSATKDTHGSGERKLNEV